MNIILTTKWFGTFQTTLYQHIHEFGVWESPKPLKFWYKLYLPLVGYALLLCLFSCNNQPGNQIKEEENKRLPNGTTIVDSSMEVHSAKTVGNAPKMIEIDDPHATIKRIFTTFTEFQESTDSLENLDSMSAAIALIGRDSNWISPSSLRLLLDVWLYYDVTDFPKRDIIGKRLQEQPVLSIEAITRRIEDKEVWEDINSSAFEDLRYLREEIGHPH